MPMTVGPCRVFLGTHMRGAPDDLRLPLEAMAAGYREQRIASQQLADRGVASALLGAVAAGGRADTFLERDYLSERTPRFGDAAWLPGGDYEDNRQCLVALLRAGVGVRLDDVGGALQHANFLVGAEPLSPGLPPRRAIVTSANLTPGNLRRHFNWLAIVDDAGTAEALESLFAAIRDGDFRRSGVGHHRVGEGVDLVYGAENQVLQALDRRFAAAAARIDLAVFNMSTSSPLIDTLVERATIGVAVGGVVDGDQGRQAWNAVPRLRAAGAGVRYYPGRATGGLGRMHYKLAVIDDRHVYLGTANVSRSAEDALEIALFVDAAAVAGGAALVAGLRAEIARLDANARTNPPGPA